MKNEEVLGRFVGVMTALKAGVAPSAVRRLLEETKVTCEQVKKASMVKSK